ncbi:hypothetical protein, partial [Streptomyces puniciscabiei]|uniref:hypothetical protein n=1 Tax=Streptomyces puniciscabiei TaxID=164348 RepID=UPI00333196A8
RRTRAVGPDLRRRPARARDHPGMNAATLLTRLVPTSYSSLGVQLESALTPWKLRFGGTLN